MSFQSLDNYREVFELMDDIILILRRDGIIEYVNRALKRKLVTPDRWFMGTNILESLLKNDPGIPHEKALEWVFRQQQFVSVYHHGDGMNLSLEWRLHRFEHEGEEKILAIIRDVSSEKNQLRKVENYNRHLQSMIYDHQRQVEQQKVQQESLERAQSLFLSRVAHELRTPLTAINGYLELLMENQLPKEKCRQYFGVIQRNSKEMLTMVDEILAMIKLEQNRYVLHEEAFDLHQLLDDVLETCDVLASNKSLTLTKELSTQVPQKMYADPQALRQILLNLLGNAIKFTDAGSVILRVKMRHHHGKAKKTIYFYVEDSGRGIPQDKQQEVFRRFEQLRDRPTSGQSGTGLGLSISRQLSNLMGGKVRLVHSEVNEGSTFLCSLPFRSPEESSRDIAVSFPACL